MEDIQTNPLTLIPVLFPEWQILAIALVLSVIISMGVTQLIKGPIKAFVRGWWCLWLIRTINFLVASLIGWLQVRGWDGLAAGMLGGFVSPLFYDKFMRFVETKLDQATAAPAPRKPEE